MFEFHENNLTIIFESDIIEFNTYIYFNNKNYFSKILKYIILFI